MNFPSCDNIRKIRKVVVERKRRQRIDRCLEQLRVIIQADVVPPALCATEGGSGNFLGVEMVGSLKLEKADILEQTVDYLYSLSRQQAVQTAQGFVSCLQEVRNFLQNEAPPAGYQAPLRVQLLTQLTRRARQLTSDQQRRFTLREEHVKSEHVMTVSGDVCKTVVAGATERNDGVTIGVKLLSDENRTGCHGNDQQRVDVTYRYQRHQQPSLEYNIHRGREKLRSCRGLKENILNSKTFSHSDVTQNKEQGFSQMNFCKDRHVIRPTVTRDTNAMKITTDRKVPMNVLLDLKENNTMPVCRSWDDTRGSERMRYLETVKGRSTAAAAVDPCLIDKENALPSTTHRRPLQDLPVHVNVNIDGNGRSIADRFSLSPMWRPW